MPVLENYTHWGGVHPETAALANTLIARGISMPSSSRPYSEAMLLGIGGGLGAGYILWEFKPHHSKVLVLGFRNNWQYGVRYFNTLCERIGVETTWRETGSAKTAAAHLAQALERGFPPIAWVDWAHLPYLQLPDALKAHFSHLVGVCGADGDDVLIDDLGAAPFRVPHEQFAAARSRIGSNSNRLLLVEGLSGARLDLPDAIRAGIAGCIAQLGGDSESFSLPAIRKWAKMTTDRRNAKGWPNVFADGRGLYGMLSSMYEGIELNGTGGGGLRLLYADFLSEAADLLDQPSLERAAALYRDCAAIWTAAANAALPDLVAPLAQTGRLLRRKYQLLRTQADGAHDEVAAIAAELAALWSANNADFPLNAADRLDLFAAIGERLRAVYDAELTALDALCRAV